METVEGRAVDRFQFHLEIPDGDISMEFALSLNDKWDNNKGKTFPEKYLMFEDFLISCIYIVSVC